MANPARQVPAPSWLKVHSPPESFAAASHRPPDREQQEDDRGACFAYDTQRAKVRRSGLRSRKYLDRDGAFDPALGFRCRRRRCACSTIVIHTLRQFVQLYRSFTKGLRAIAPDIWHNFIVDVRCNGAKLFLHSRRRLMQAVLPWLSRDLWRHGTLLRTSMRIAKTAGQGCIGPFVSLAPNW